MVIKLGLEHRNLLPEDVNDVNFQEEFEPFESSLILSDADRGFVHKERDTPYKYWLSSYARSRIIANQNFILLGVGSTGTGKSYNFMELARDLDPNFTTDRIVFHPENFIKVVKQHPPRGSVIMWDEVGVGLSSREWWTIQNKMIAYVLETFRRDNLILLMTTPNIGFIDKKVRALLHGFSETIDRTFTGGQWGWIKYFHIFVNLREARMMYRYPRIVDKHGRTRVLRGRSSLHGNIRISEPPDWLTKSYEEKKLVFTESLQEKALDILTRDTKSTKLEVSDILDAISNDPAEYGLLDEAGITHIVNKAFIKMSLNYPNTRIAKSHVDSVVRYVMHERGIGTENSRTLGDNMLETVLNLYETETDARGVAKAMDEDKDVIMRSVRDWKQRGMWPAD